MKSAKIKRFRFRNMRVNWIIFIVIAVFALHSSAQAQNFNSTTAGDILTQMRSFRTQWTTNIWVYARRLFWFLAFIEFGWSVIALALDKTDLQSWVSGLLRKLMWIGAFYALLDQGNKWIPNIIDSFEQIGQNASGLGPISPSDVFVQGLDVAGSLLAGASGSSFLSGDVASALLCALGALLVFISYVIITINLVVTLVESYLIVSAGYIFLGFGGSRWTAPYTERYIGLAVSIGIKLLVLYCIIAAGQSLGAGWNAEAAGIGDSATPAKLALDVIGGALIYMMCCWQIPKIFGAVIGGSPALTGGDLVATGTAVAAGALAVASLGAGAVATAAGAGATGAAGSGSAALGTSAAAQAGATGSSVANAVSTVGSGTAAGSSTAGNAAGSSVVRPPTSAVSHSSNGSYVAPPTNGTSPGSNGSFPKGEGGSSRNGGGGSTATALEDLGGEQLSGSGFESERPTRGFPSSTRSSGKTNTVPPPTSEGKETNSQPSDESPVDQGDAGAGSGDTPDKPTSPSTQGNRFARGAGKTRDRLRAVSDTVRKVRLNDGHSPGSPPRMPIDPHE